MKDRMRRCAWLRAGVMALAVLWASCGFAQHFGQPIYPAYQGFVDNPDGSVTVVFQYFSHGRDVVELPVGPSNHFSGVEDRNQPTTFSPGNHEDVCVMVLENRREVESLRWTLAFPNEPSSTSSDPLNPEYMLMERAQQEANRAIDHASAPRGVCLNKPPRIFANGRRFQAEEGEIAEISAKVGEEVELKGMVLDEGLPRGSEVTATWRKVSGPGEIEFSSPSEPSSRASFSESGTYLLELRAGDGELEASDQLRVEVEASGA